MTPLGPRDGWQRYAVHHTLDPKVYDNAVTLTFVTPGTGTVAVRAGGRALAEKTSSSRTGGISSTTGATRRPRS